MDPREQLLVDKQMRMREQRLFGIYHSHTATEAYPSSVDVTLSIGPDVSYVLVSLKHAAAPVIRSYRIDLLRPRGQQVVEEPVEIVG
jgi:proteasome lid subunit RPN8/RPN11